MNDLETKPINLSDKAKKNHLILKNFFIENGINFEESLNLIDSSTNTRFTSIHLKINNIQMLYIQIWNDGDCWLKWIYYNLEYVYEKNTTNKIFGKMSLTDSDNNLKKNLEKLFNNVVLKLQKNWTEYSYSLNK